jgi:hypothetical protein
MSTPEEYAVEVQDSKEVWWATTKEYDLLVDGNLVRVRIAENPKGTDFYMYEDGSGWTEQHTDDGVMAIVYEAWSNGELD